MRISDWSSDVCSSDLRHGGANARLDQVVDLGDDIGIFRIIGRKVRRDIDGVRAAALKQGRTACEMIDQNAERQRLQLLPVGAAFGLRHGNEVPPVENAGHVAKRKERARQRSEEHTSELQSLMRISYAVFCLKKK